MCCFCIISYIGSQPAFRHREETQGSFNWKGSPFLLDLSSIIVLTIYSGGLFSFSVRVNKTSMAHEVHQLPSRQVLLCCFAITLSGAGQTHQLHACVSAGPLPPSPPCTSAPVIKLDSITFHGFKKTQNGLERAGRLFKGDLLAGCELVESHSPTSSVTRKCRVWLRRVPAGGWGQHVERSHSTVLVADEIKKSDISFSGSSSVFLSVLN